MEKPKTKILYGTKYIARRLKVSTNVVYWWMKMSEREREEAGSWGHDPCPAAVVAIKHSDDGSPVKVWTKHQLPEWDEWYSSYQESRRSKAS